ncbi:MAG: TonB-dependent receptor [Cyclobacteriaceae bacterium]|nr:TonB-dependent receptor [Cyclobacteriaceae bacterium]MCH8516779.1 TonB-dependent receptor [Cyclobacteriaceae bacterium]
MKHFLLTKFVFLVFSMGVLFAQDRTVSGTVTDFGSSNPLPGVTVQVKGGDGVITDINGRYRINVPNEEAILVFSSIGYLSDEVRVGARSVIDIDLVENIEQLSEVIVVGYGTQLKQDLTGNIAKVSGKDMENIPVPSVEGALQGRAAGVFVESGNGKVGQGMKVRVRGAASVSGDNQPLYVVDGVIITSDNLSGVGAATNPLADINFNDIESMEVLKDASATAIYGSRGANGVIVITTKSGKSGQTQYNFNAQYGASSPTRLRNFVQGEDYTMLIREAAANADRVENDDFWVGFVDSRIDLFRGGTEPGSTNSDWQREAFQDARFQQYDFSANGGDEKTRFYISGQYTDQDGILIKNNLERISGRLKLEHKASERVSLGMNMSLSRTVNNRVAPDNEFANPMQLVAQPPITPIRNEFGELNDRPITPYYNGLVEAEFADFVTTVFRNISKVYADIQITPELKFHSQVGVDILTQNEDRFQASNTLAGIAADNTGVGLSRWVQVSNYINTNYLNYQKVVGRSVIDATLGFEYQDIRRDFTRVQGQGIPNDDLRKLASAADITVGRSDLIQTRFVSYFARINYKLADKYLISLNNRYDGSSRFGADNRFGFFPSASVGWIASDEGFLSGVESLSFLKPRVSYGLAGNAAIGDYTHFGLYEAASLAGVPGLRPFQVANPDLGWETTAQLNAGIDFGFFNDRITGEIDYYKKVTNDLLLAVPIPNTSGFNSVSSNLGSVENEGIEFVLNTQNISRQNFSWNSSFNIAFNRNIVTSIGDQEIIDTGAGRYMNVVQEGSPLGAFLGAEYAGVDPATGDAIWFLNREVRDGETTVTVDGREATNNFNSAEFVILGDPNADYFGGFNNNFTFGNFDLTVFLQWVGGFQIHRAGDGFMGGNQDWVDNQLASQLDRWQQPGDITDIPEARFGLLNGQQQRSSRYLSDGDYLRLKTVSFGYTFPKSFTDRISVRTARVYVQGQNLLTFTNYDGWDPEVTTDFLASNVFQSIDFYSAPQARTYTVGLSIGF